MSQWDQRLSSSSFSTILYSGRDTSKQGRASQRFSSARAEASWELCFASVRFNIFSQMHLMNISPEHPYSNLHQIQCQLKPWSHRAPFSSCVVLPFREADLLQKESCKKATSNGQSHPFQTASPVPPPTCFGRCRTAPRARNIFQPQKVRDERTMTRGQGGGCQGVPGAFKEYLAS